MIRFSNISKLSPFIVDDTLFNICGGKVSIWEAQARPLTMSTNVCSDRRMSE